MDDLRADEHGHDPAEREERAERHGRLPSLRDAEPGHDHDADRGRGDDADQ